MAKSSMRPPGSELPPMPHITPMNAPDPPEITGRKELILLPTGGPVIVKKTVVIEYDIGPYPDGAPTDPCQVKCTMPLPPKEEIPDGTKIVGVALQPIMDGEEWPDNFATRVVTLDEESWNIIFLVQRTDNPSEPWGSHLSVNTTYQIG